MAQLRTVTSYANRMRDIVYQGGYVYGGAIEVREPINRSEGIVYADELKFKDGATLRFFEHIKVIGPDEIERIRYSLKYHSVNGLSFMYDKDPDRYLPVIHEVCHLQVNSIKDGFGRDLRFKTHSTSFSEFYNFIVACFYGPL